nr:hypothetical protein [Tanacetum cinerariifolium]GEV97548.1 hypothetical protein [Tanacetum cinerariifolium]
MTSTHAPSTRIHALVTNSLMPSINASVSRSNMTAPVLSISIHATASLSHVWVTHAPSIHAPLRLIHASISHLSLSLFHAQLTSGMPHARSFNSCRRGETTVDNSDGTSTSGSLSVNANKMESEGVTQKNNEIVDKDGVAHIVGGGNGMSQRRIKKLIRLGVIHLGLIRLGLVHLGLIRLGLIRLEQKETNSPWSNSHWINSPWTNSPCTERD